MAVAVGCLAAQVALLRQYDAQTDQIIKDKEKQTDQAMKKLEADARKITVRMGFNLLILPEGQTLSGLYDDQAQQKFMPDEYAAKLASEKVITINHVLPALTQSVKWPERNRRIILTGVKGEVYIQSGEQKPILSPVPAGSVVLGYELHKSFNINKGDSIEFMGRKFKAGKLHDEQGSRDDATIWMNLSEVQELLQKPGKINSILALECECQADRLANIRKEVTALLPGTQVIEFKSQALARSEIRLRTAEESAQSIQRERENRQKLKDQRVAFGAVFVPIVILGAAIWVAFLMLGNVRDRAPETGVLRAIGLRSWQIISLFLGRAVAIGLVGAVIGALGGLAVAAFWQGAPSWRDMLAMASPPDVYVAAVVLAPLLSAAASWLPAFLASRQDPATVLQKE
ncbi:MAG: FtsX-like permease family protein [Planctomycetes bacterium]|nr:FtsX-like permease family protein [Planctomycetota bacterium]